MNATFEPGDYIAYYVEGETDRRHGTVAAVAACDHGAPVLVVDQHPRDDEADLVVRVRPHDAWIA